MSSSIRQNAFEGGKKKKRKGKTLQQIHYLVSNLKTVAVNRQTTSKTHIIPKKKFIIQCSFGQPIGYGQCLGAESRINSERKDNDH
jgi:hypothetical protein